MDRECDETVGGDRLGSGVVSGLYVGALSLLSRKPLVAVTDDILTQAKQVPFGKGETFCIGDFGCADGGTSTEIIQHLLSGLKHHYGNNTTFTIIYEDQACNDFNALFLKLDNKFSGLENVFTFACGTSFYKQCCSSGTMHVILSFYSAHWLSRRPTTFRNSICILRECSKKERELVLQQAESDWETFLLMRNKELRTGGRLFVVLPSDGAPDDRGAYKVHNGKFLKLVSSIWQSWTENGTISQEEFINTNMDTCHYNLRQLQAPFHDTQSPVYKSGLRLQSVKNISCYLPEYLEWKHRLERDGIDDRKTFAKKFVDIRRCFTNNVFLNGLSSERSVDEKEMLVNDLYRQAEDVVSSWNPEDLKNEMMYVYLCVYKL